MILGVIAARRGEWQEVIPRFRTVIRLAPTNPHGYFYLGQAYLYQRRWQDAVRFFTEALRRNYPERSRLLVELALARYEAGTPQEALATLEQMGGVPEAPHTARYYAVMASVRSALDQPDAALESIRRARDLDTSNPHHWEFLISHLIETSQLSLALAESIQAQKKFPDEPAIQFLFGLAGYQFGYVHLTELALRNLTELETGDPRISMLKGLAHYLRGQKEAAMREFADAARHGVRGSKLLLALVLKDSGDLVKAERYLREAEPSNPRDGQLQFELAKISLLRGETSEALTRLQKAAKLMPREPMVQYRLATLYRKLGDSRKANEHSQSFEKLKKERDTELANSPVRRLDGAAQEGVLPPP